MDTLKLCENELNKYMRIITGSCGEITLISDGDKDLFKERIEIAVNAGKGYIRGNRPRAVLLGVYEFLRRVGCEFLRPGNAGEHIPHKPLSELTVAADITPANRHRGITIEGAVSLENVLDIIEWAPKVGFNSYFVQFRTGFEFFDRWYSHASNPTLKSKVITIKDSEQFVQRIVSAIKERDMIYHAVGHGWTSECLGIKGEGWKTEEVDLSESQLEMTALVKGKRGLFGGVPLNTQLCYSNAKVRAQMVEEVVKYAKNNPQTDVIHFWLADAFNNVCECENCRKKRFSDWYVMMLNDIDERLTGEGLNVKICFLVYFDLYWKPLYERIRNNDRFIMMFAPLFRTFTQSYDGAESIETANYELNAVDYPRGVGAYLGFLREWQQIFDGDSFDFDYHLMWDINRDFGGSALAGVLYKDVRSLKALGLNGFMSCQIQRAFYPNGLTVWLMGRSLFDGEISFEQLQSDYYSAAFGKYCDFARVFYATLDEKVPFSYFEGGRTDKPLGEMIPTLKEAENYLESILSQMPNGGDSVSEESLKILAFLARNTLYFVKVLLLKAQGVPKEQSQAAEQAFKEHIYQNEMRFQPYFDEFYTERILMGLIESRDTGIYA